MTHKNEKIMTNLVAQMVLIFLTFLVAMVALEVFPRVVLVALVIFLEIFSLHLVEMEEGLERKQQGVRI